MTTPLNKLLHDCIGASGAAALNAQATDDELRALGYDIDDGVLLEPLERQFHPDDPSNPHVRRWW